MHKIHHNIYLCRFYLHLFQKHLGTFSGRNFLTRMSPNVYWTCRTSWGIFFWPEAVLGNFYWPGAIGSPLASSPDIYVFLLNKLYCKDIHEFCLDSILFPRIFLFNMNNQRGLFINRLEYKLRIFVTPLLSNRAALTEGDQLMSSPPFRLMSSLMRGF